jgi:DNA-binding NarL/FixJ family response regulator
VCPVSARAASQTLVVAVVDRLRPDPGLMDDRVGEVDRVGVGQKLSQVPRKDRVVALSAHGDPAPVQQAEHAITW